MSDPRIGTKMRLYGRPLLVLTGVLATACLKVPRQTAFMSTLETVDLPTGEARLIVEDFGRRFVATMETAADSIYELSDDSEVKRRALNWKIYGIPLAQEATLLQDPVIAMLDLWTFAVQMRNYLEEGPGIDAFGPHQEIAVNTVRDLVNSSVATAGRMTRTGAVGDSGIMIVETFAADNPFDTSTLTRRSIMSLLVAEVGSDHGGIAGTAASVDRRLGEIATRLSFYNEYLMKQVRWNMQVLLEDLATVQQLDTTLVSLRTSVDRLADLADTVPNLVGSEREIVLEAINRDLVLIMDAIDRQRIAAVGALQAEIDTVMKSLSAERELVLDAIREERNMTLAMLDTVLANRIDQTKTVVDHAVWRVAQLLAVMGVVLLVVLVVAMRLLRTSRAA